MYRGISGIFDANWERGIWEELELESTMSVVVYEGVDEWVGDV